MQTVTERLNVRVLDRRVGEGDPISDASTPEIGVEHEHHLVERPRALVLWRDEKQHLLWGAGAGALDELSEPIAQLLHLARRPYRGGILGESRHFVRTHRRARREDQVGVGQLAPVGDESAALRVDAVCPGLHEVDVSTCKGIGGRVIELRRRLPERDVDRVRLEQEIVVLGHDRQVHVLAHALPEVERRLQPCEPTTDDNDVWLIRQGWSPARYLVSAA